MTNDTNISRRRFLVATGGTAGAVGLAGCSSSDRTPTPTEGGGDDNGGGDGTPTAEPMPESSAWQDAKAAFETVQDNLTPTDEAAQTRAEAYVTIEEANWEDVVLVNAFHGATERFSYDYVDAPKFGAMGTSRQKVTQFDKGDNPNGRTLERINATNGSGGFDPVKSGDTASGTVVQNVYDGLMNYPNGETVTESLLAAEFETNDDFTEYTFTLEDATFHNGDPVTAEDFVYAFERLAYSPNSVRSYFILDSLGVSTEGGDGDYAEDGLAVFADDESTFRIQLSQAFHQTLEMLAYSSFAVYPKGIAGGSPSDEQDDEGNLTDSYREFLENNPVGAGPFQFDSWEKGTSVDISRYDDYYGEAANLEAVHWQVIEDDEAAYQYAMNQNADIFGIPTAQYSQDNVQNASKDESGRTVGEYGPLANDQTAQYLKVPEVSTFYFGFNTQAVPKPVRQAVAYVTNQEQLASQVFKNRQSPAYHLTPPLIYPGGGNAYDDHVGEAYPYSPGEQDIASAVQVMEDAGFGEDNRFEMTFTHYQSTVWSEIAQILQGALSEAYIDMDIEEAQFGTLLDRGRQGNLQAYTLGWIADWPAADNFLQLIYPPNTVTGQTGVLTYTNWGIDQGLEVETESE
jgi:peptide/nickel transport system substrate-binding protein